MFVSTQTIKNQIEASLRSLSANTQEVCLELIMSLNAEDRLVYLNRYVQQIAILEQATHLRLVA